jgi:hypothetical protein
MICHTPDKVTGQSEHAVSFSVSECNTASSWRGSGPTASQIIEPVPDEAQICCFEGSATA